MSWCLRVADCSADIRESMFPFKRVLCDSSADEFLTRTPPANQHDWLRNVPEMRMQSWLFIARALQQAVTRILKIACGIYLTWRNIYTMDSDVTGL
jgi:hypothetical protein